MTHWISLGKNSSEVISNAKPCREFETSHWQNRFLSDFSHLSVFVLHYILLCTQTWVHSSITVSMALNKRWHNGVCHCQSDAKKSMILRKCLQELRIQDFSQKDNDGSLYGAVLVNKFERDQVAVTRDPLVNRQTEWQTDTTETLPSHNFVSRK